MKASVVPAIAMAALAFALFVMTPLGDKLRAGDEDNDASAAVASSAATVTGSPILVDDFTTGLDPAWLVLDRMSDDSNNEQNCYRQENVRVRDGVLEITSRVESRCAAFGGYKYTSGMLQWHSLTFLYGQVEVRARVGGGQGPWPALWFLGATCIEQNITFSYEGCDWPNPGSDEIDMMEMFSGRWNQVKQGVHRLDRKDECRTSVTGTNWNTYGMRWEPNRITFYVNGKASCTVTGKGVPDSPMFMIVNQAVGGNGGGKIDDKSLPRTFEIDYVHITSLN